MIFYYNITPKQGRQRMYKRSIEARSHNHCRPGKAVLHIVRVCSCVRARIPLDIQHAEHMRRIVL